MLYKKCACGCGKWIAVKHKNHKYYDREHRKRHLYRLAVEGSAKEETEEKALSTKRMTPEQRWEAMSLSECGSEALRLRMSYGKLQSMYYNNTLPKDFGIKILEKRG